MPIEGSLREFTVEDVFQLLHMARKTGELTVIREPSGERAVVIFDSGAVVGVGRDNGAPNLGQLLVAAGTISDGELRRGEELRRANPERTWVEVFISLGVATREELERSLRFQVEETVYDILEWRDGRFTFRERAVSDAESVAWIPTESLLMEGARRADELSALPSGIEGPGTVPMLSNEAVEGGMIDLAPEDWEVLARVDGVSDLKSIAWALGRSEFEVSKVLSRLVEQGLLEVSSTEARTKPPHVVALDEAEEMIGRDALDEARGRLESVLARHPDEPRAHYLAGRLAQTSGDLKAAVRDYERTLTLDPLAEEARLHLGLVRLKLGDVEGATREWAAYLRMAPDSHARRQVERAMSAAHELLTVLDDFDGRKRA